MISAGVLIGVASMIGLAAADANVWSAKNSNASTDHDGVSAGISGDSFNPDAGNCVLYAIVTEDYSHYRQLEAGKVRCNDTAVDGTCDDVKWVETARFGPGEEGFHCYPHGGFNNGTIANFQMIRRSASSAYFDAFVSGNQYEWLGNFTGEITLAAWGEVTPGSSCNGSGPTTGRFTNWQRFRYPAATDGSHYLTGTDDQDCNWHLSSTTSTRDCSVSK